VNISTAILRDLIAGQSTADSITGRIHATEKREGMPFTTAATVTAALGVLALDGRIESHRIGPLFIYRISAATRQRITDKKTN
jgi:hypothetical protein